MSKYSILGTTLTAIADAVRSKIFSACKFVGADIADAIETVHAPTPIQVTPARTRDEVNGTLFITDLLDELPFANFPVDCVVKGGEGTTENPIPIQKMSSVKVTCEDEDGNTRTVEMPLSEEVWGLDGDLATGVVYSAYKPYDLTSMSWRKTVSGGRVLFTATTGISDWNCQQQAQQKEMAFMDRYKRITFVQQNQAGYTGLSSEFWSGSLVIRDDSLAETTVDEFKALMNGVILYYRSKTKTPVGISNNIIIPFCGKNTLSVENGSVAYSVPTAQLSTDILGFLNHANKSLVVNDALLNSPTAKIAPAAFNAFAGVQEVSLAKVVEIGDNAFKQCENLKKVYMPKCKKIGAGAFYYNRKLFYGDFPECEEIGQGAFCSVAGTVSTSNERYFNFPKLKIIGTNAFEDSQAFYDTTRTKEFLFDSVETIGTGAFAQSLNLGYFQAKTFSFESVVSIEQQAFRYMRADNFIIGDTCTTLGKSVFFSALITNLYCKAVTPPTVDTSLGFGSGTDITNIYVPAESVAAYQAATGWSDFASIIQAIPTT